MSSLLKVALMVLSVAGCSSCREPGRLSTFAASAKQRGEKTTKIFDKVPRVTSDNLESALRESSVVLATASAKQMIVTTPDMVGSRAASARWARESAPSLIRRDWW